MNHQYQPSGRVPHLPEEDPCRLCGWPQRAKRHISPSACDHNWQPVGLTFDQSENSLKPTDYCLDCGAIRYPYDERQGT